MSNDTHPTVPAMKYLRCTLAMRGWAHNESLGPLLDTTDNLTPDPPLESSESSDQLIDTGRVASACAPLQYRSNRQLKKAAIPCGAPHPCPPSLLHRLFALRVLLLIQYPPREPRHDPVSRRWLATINPSWPWPSSTLLSLGIGSRRLGIRCGGHGGSASPPGSGGVHPRPPPPANTSAAHLSLVSDPDKSGGRERTKHA
eukprot:1181883-Prorocentrum_minimum.AAC.1